MGTGYALLMTTFNATRLQHAISRIEADYQRSADTHLFALAAKMHINAQLP